MRFQKYGLNKEAFNREVGNLDADQNKSRDEADLIWQSQLLDRLYQLKHQLLQEKLELENEVLNGVRAVFTYLGGDLTKKFCTSTIVVQEVKDSYSKVAFFSRRFMK